MRLVVLSAMMVFFSTSAQAQSPRDEALAAVLAEPKVKDAAWATSSLWIGVIDDGTRRDGLAMYFCQVLRQYSAHQRVKVKIMDVAAAARKQPPREIGVARCD